MQDQLSVRAATGICVLAVSRAGIFSCLNPNLSSQLEIFSVKLDFDAYGVVATNCRNKTIQIVNHFKYKSDKMSLCLVCMKGTLNPIFLQLFCGSFRIKFRGLRFIAIFGWLEECTNVALFSTGNVDMTIYCK